MASLSPDGLQGALLAPRVPEAPQEVTRGCHWVGVDVGGPCLQVDVEAPPLPRLWALWMGAQSKGLCLDVVG